MNERKRSKHQQPSNAQALLYHRNLLSNSRDPNAGQLNVANVPLSIQKANAIMFGTK